MMTIAVKPGGGALRHAERMVRNTLALTIVGLLGLPSASHAQAVSPAMGGASLEELQRGINPRQVGGIEADGAVSVPQITEDSPVSAEDQRKIQIAGFRLVGQSVFPEDQLKEIAQAQPGEYTFHQLEALARRITEYYRGKGYLVAQAVIPAQESKEGVVTLQIVEGRLDAEPSIDASDDESAAAIAAIYKATVCTKAVDEDQCEGVFATEALVQRIIMLSRENTNMKVFGTLSEGTKPGYTHLSINARHGRKVLGEVSVDNTGSDSTGKLRFQGHAVANSLFTLGDTLDVIVGASNKPASYKFFQFDYSLPVTPTGWRVGTNVAQTQYYLSGAFAPLQASGTARSVGFYAKYPLLLTSDARADLTLSFKAGRLQDDNVIYTNPRSFWQSAVDLAGRFEDRWLSTPAITLWGARVERGGVRITDAIQQQADAITLKTAGVYDRFTLRASREQGLGGRWSVFGSFAGAVADKNLDPFVKFSLGGPFAVRAYPGGEASGDIGAIGSAELRYALPPVNLFSHQLSTRLAAFYDRGWVKISDTPYSSLLKNTDLRAGYGLQVELTDTQTMGVRLFWAKAAGTGPSTSDQSASRVGVTVSTAF